MFTVFILFQCLCGELVIIEFSLRLALQSVNLDQSDTLVIVNWEYRCVDDILGLIARGTGIYKG